MQAVRWYDRIAGVYDLALPERLLYRDARAEAVARLGLSPGDAVLDLFCGTGTNFPLLQERIGSEGRIVGIDGSAGMLLRASAAAHRSEGAPILLLRADFASADGVARVAEALSRHRPAGVLLTLGLTCLPGWRDFFRAVYDAAPVGARFSILDVHCERLSPGARLINAAAAADCTRPVWRGLEERAADFARRSFRSLRLLDAEVFVAAGRKAAGAGA